MLLHLGRTIDSIKSFSKEVGIENFLISGNGAAVYNMKKDEILYSKFLSKEQVFLYYYKENLKKPESKRTFINIVPDMLEYIQNLKNENFLKITICDEDIKIFNSIIKKIKMIDKFGVLDVEYMSRKKIKSGTEEFLIEYYYTEITNENVNKWTAIEYLINKIGIDKKDVVAIGDNMNDREMIENSGLGIVMGNANPFMKICGDIIVADNNSDGVCQAFEKYILR